MPSVSSSRFLAGCCVCTVEQCADCDEVKLQVGETTLQLKRGAFMLMCETLLGAWARLAPEVTVVTRIHGGPISPGH